MSLNIRHTQVLVVALAALFMGGCCCCCNSSSTTPQLTETDEEAVTRIVGEYITAVAAGDHQEFCRVANFPTEDMTAEFQQELKAQYAESHNGLASYEAKVVEINDDFAHVVAEIRMRDGYTIELGKENPGMFPDMFLPKLYRLKKQQDQWRLDFKRPAPKESATNTASAFLNSVLNGDESYSRYVSEQHSSTAAKDAASNAVQSISKFKNSLAKVAKSGLTNRKFTYQRRLISIDAKKDLIKYGFRVLPERKSWNFGELDSIVIAVVKENERWNVSLNDSRGLAEIGRLPSGKLLPFKDQPKAPSSKPKKLRRPTNDDELKNFARTIAKATGKSLMQEIGGGQDLVVNVVGVNYDRIADEFEIDIQVSFNGKIWRSDNYQVAGRITVNGDGTKANFARTQANKEYLKWESEINTAVVMGNILEAAIEASKD